MFGDRKLFTAIIWGYFIAGWLLCEVVWCYQSLWFGLQYGPYWLCLLPTPGDMACVILHSICTGCFLSGLLLVTTAVGCHATGRRSVPPIAPLHLFRASVDQRIWTCMPEKNGRRRGVSLLPCHAWQALVLCIPRCAGCNLHDRNASAAI